MLISWYSGRLSEVGDQVCVNLEMMEDLVSAFHLSSSSSQLVFLRTSWQNLANFRLSPPLTSLDESPHHHPGALHHAAVCYLMSC